MPEEIQESAEVLPVAPNSPAEQNPSVSTAEAETAGDPESQDQPKSKGVQRRIDELTKNWREEQRRNQELIDLLKARDPKQEPEKPKADPEAPVRPIKANYSDWDKYDDDKDAYHEALAEYKVRKALEGIKAEARQKEVQTEQQKRLSAWHARQAKAREVHEDFDEVVQNPYIPISDSMADCIVDSEVGEEIAYFLGKNKAEAERISKIQSPFVQAKEIGKIEARLAHEKSAEAKADPDPPAQTRAPKPPTPINKTSSTDNSLHDDLSFKEFVRRRDASQRSK